MAFIEDPVNFEANQTGLSRSQQREAVKQEQRALNAANEGKVDADGNAYVPLVVDGIVGPKTEAAKNFKPVVQPSGTNNNDPAQVVPSDQTTDDDGETRYIQNEDGAWYNNPAFYEKPVKPADADTAPPDANGNQKYFTTTDAKGNTVWNINPDYQ